MSPPAADPLALGQKLVSILDDGLRTATYKLATLIALLDHAVEHVPADTDAEVHVDLDDLAARVIALYWRPVRDLDGHYLRQSSNPVARIPDTVRTFRTLASRVGGTEPTVDVAARSHPTDYLAAVATVKQVLVTQPLYRLQRVRGAQRHEYFLYDDTWLSDRVSARTLAHHNNRITLLPGVCTTLARLSSLMRPALQISWLDDVRRLNPFLHRDVPDLAAHHFGADRISLDRARSALLENFGPRCFYCDAPTTQHVDHVLPWSRVGLDGLSNLVLACARCNLNKSHLLPDPQFVARALDRGRDRLTDIAETIAWPSQYDRVASAAHGLYATQPAGTPLWLGHRRVDTIRTDFAWPRFTTMTESGE
ncbi:HNH endonuclease [Williamsia sp. Leaf354]|uniref:HNH endonuclease n=1 Tax=Williamsia sp. Leaf354 TaxID=1736349 RepID=UPI0006FC0750|nr:HNH endonuclease [Williamsia sp. Leaf354]KQS00749.1 HNH endonuclease [Williamsia sp. Leaf354]